MRMKMKKDTMELISKCVDRAELTGIYSDRMSYFMDLDYADKDVGIDFEVLLGFDEENFKHDILGISHNMNRQSKKLDNCFLPRSSRGE